MRMVWAVGALIFSTQHPHTQMYAVVPLARPEGSWGCVGGSWRGGEI